MVVIDEVENMWKKCSWPVFLRCCSCICLERPRQNTDIL